MKNVPPRSIYDCNQYLSRIIHNRSVSSETVFSYFKSSIAESEVVSPNEYTYGIMLTYCAEIKRLNLAFSFFARLLKEGHRINAVVFNPIIKALCSENRFGEVTSILKNKMPMMGCIPDSISYGTVIKGLISKGYNTQALQLFYKTVKLGGKSSPTAVTYNTIIDCLIKNNKIYQAACLFDQMRFLGFEHDIVTYGSFIKGLCNEGKPDKAEKLLDEIIREGLIKPDVVIYNIIVDGLCKKGDIKKAEKVIVDRMRCDGIEPDVVTYTILIDGYCKHGETDKAQELMTRLSALGLISDVAPYNTLIDAWLRKGESEKATKILHEMRLKGKLKPNAVTYKILNKWGFKYR